MKKLLLLFIVAFMLIGVSGCERVIEAEKDINRVIKIVNYIEKSSEYVSDDELIELFGHLDESTLKQVRGRIGK